MNFEQLQEIAKEQNTRIFSLDCSVGYRTLYGFDKHHFSNLRKNDINNACWEVLIKLRFPFEAIIPQVDTAFLVHKTLNNVKTVTGLTAAFNLFILNRPEMSMTDIKNLIYNFIETFDHVLTRDFKFPIEITNSYIILNLTHSHSFFKVLSDNHII